MPVLRCLLVVATIAALGCGKETEEPRGSPILKSVTWQAEDGTPKTVWSRDADAAVAAVVPASGSRIDFVFDGKLDGARIEDTVGGSPVPKANPPITVGWPDMATVMSNPAFAVDVFYNSLPANGKGTTTAFVQTHAPGFPSATAVTFVLDPNGLTSIYGEPMVGPTEITVTTEPLVVTLPLSGAIVSTSYRAPIAFSTRGPATAALKAFVQVTTGGAALPFDLMRDTADAKRLLAVPMGCLWPPGARIDVSVAAGAPDAFGRPLATGVTASFMTAPFAAEVDAGCGFDAGVTDASPGDTGASDADTSDAGTTDGDPTDGGTTDAEPADAA
jgi:hypothetical protein